MPKTAKFNPLDPALAPAEGRQQRITKDPEQPGLGVRVTGAGARAWVLAYSTRAGIERRMTIGAVADWPVPLAREEARRLRRLVDLGEDPLASREADRAAPSVTALVERWRQDIAPRKRPRSLEEDEGLIRQWVIPELGERKVAEVRRADIEKLHQKITAHTPIRANRTVALLSRLFNLAVRWEMRADNPATQIERNPEIARHRYLDGAEMGRLLAALPTMRSQQAADVIRLLLLTGARRGEIFRMEWDQLDLEKGTWTKPHSLTKQKRMHRVPLSGPARQILIDIKSAAEASAERYARPLARWVFPAHGRRDQPIVDVKTSWAWLCRTAQLSDLHLHDLRHAYATFLASSGSNLPLIGQLLGHTQASTTQRYAHLLDDPQREATERVAALIGAIETGKTGEVLPLRRPRKQGAG